MRRRFQEGGLNALADDSDGVADPDSDESGAVDPTAGAAPSSVGALTALDIPGADEALNLMAKSSEQARAALQQARESIMARRYGKADALLAASAALGAPTRAGSTAESFGAMAGALREPLKARQAFDVQKQKDILGVDTNLAGLDERQAMTQLQLAALRAKLTNTAAGQPLEKVVGADGKVVYRTRPEARNQQAYVPPPAQTTVNVGAEKKLFGTMGEKLGETYTNQYIAALKAPQSIQRVNQLRDLLKTNPYTGAGADWKLSVGKAAKALGFDYAGDDIKNSELLFSNLGQATLDNIKSSGLGSGNGFTDKDLKFLQQVVGGTATLDNKTLASLADLHESVARAAAKQWNSTYGRLKTTDSDALKSLGVTPIEIPEIGKSGAAVEPPATQDGEVLNPDDVAPAREPPAAGGAGGRLAPAEWAEDPANPPPRAPPEREKYLKEHPETRQQFVDHYHYLPQ